MWLWQTDTNLKYLLLLLNIMCVCVYVFMIFYDGKSRERICVSVHEARLKDRNKHARHVSERWMCVCVCASFETTIFSFLCGGGWQMKGFERTQNEIRLFWKMFIFCIRCGFTIATSWNYYPTIHSSVSSMEYFHITWQGHCYFII